MKKEVIVHKNPKSPISEIFRTLRTNIQFMNTNKEMKSLLITSTYAGEGKSWVTSNLAVTFAQAGKKVILIDADMRKGRQYAIFEVAPKPGLSNYLSQVTDGENSQRQGKNISNYLQETEIENLYILAAGSVPPNPSELLVSTRMVNLLEQLKQLCDIVIIDGTPCELVTDSVILSRIVDSTIIVTAHKKTKKDRLKRVIQNIENVGGNIAGVVLNRVPMTSKKMGDQYYYYGTSSQPKKRSINRRHNNERMKKFNERVDNNILNLNKEEYDIKEEKIPEIKIGQITNDENQETKVQNENENTTIKEENNLQDTEGNNVDKNDDKSEFLNRTNEILKQINEYIDNEKKK